MAGKTWVTSARSGGRKSTRDASSLVIAARDPSSPQGTDQSFEYRLLFLKREAKKGTFAGASVFPGGVSDAADFSQGWYQLYRGLGITAPKDFGWGHMKGKSRPGPIAAQREEGLLPNDVAFRICAIRETFEESGVLLAGRSGDVLRSKSAMGRKKSTHSTSFRDLADESVSPEILRHWRKLVHDDASRFLDMCLELGIYPDIWSIYQMSHYLTPKQESKRFDTLFYICTLDAMPEVEIDQKEITDYQWLTPAETIRLQARHEINVRLPQITECARLLDLQKMEEVQRYTASNIDLEMMRVCQIVPFTLTDGIILLLPGDDYYQSAHASDDHPPMTVAESDADSLLRGLNLNRLTITWDGHFKLVCNITLPFGGRPPRNIDSREWTGDSKL